jgi:hypothetical protein
MDYQTRQGLVIAISVILGPIFLAVLRKYRPTRFAKSFVEKRMKDGWLKRWLLKDA